MRRQSAPKSNFFFPPETMMINMKLIALAALAGAALQVQAAEGNAAAAAKDKISMCMGCHGIAGYRTTFPEVYHVPKLGGQHPAYIVKALNAYKSGERSHPTMRGIAESLTDQDIADLAAYYGEKK
jgi:cytochrome c553